MKTVVLAVFLTVVQASPPVPRQTSNQSATRSQNVQSDTTKNQDSAVSVAPTEPKESASTGKAKGQEPSEANQSRTIVVSELPAVSVRKDRWDYLYIGLTGLLVIVAGITFGAVWYQANQTAIATRAVQRNTDAFIASQKAILVADAHGNPFQMLRIGQVPRVVLDLYNRGSTTAFHCFYETWMELVPHQIANGEFTFDAINFEFSDAAYHYVSQSPLSVHPNHSAAQISTPVPGGLTPLQRSDIEKARLLVCLRLRVKFSDAFYPIRYADFGFWVMHDGLGFLAKYQDSN
jgi:hypothetical protein